MPDSIENKKELNLGEEIVSWINDNMGNRLNQTISTALINILNKHAKKEPTKETEKK